MTLSSTCVNILQLILFPGVAWIKEKGELAVKVSLTGIIQSGLCYMKDVQSKTHACVALIKGFGSNLTIESRNTFAMQV